MQLQTFQTTKTGIKLQYFFRKSCFITYFCLFASWATPSQAVEDPEQFSVGSNQSAVVEQEMVQQLAPERTDRLQSPSVKSQVRSFTVNGVSYPDASLHIPVSFVASNKSRLYAFAHYVNRVRGKNTTYGCQPDCSDAELSADIVVYARNSSSLTIQPGLQSLTSRNNGTRLGEGGYLGFRFSKSISETLAFSLGGESIFRLDNTVDLGTNAYVGVSKLYNWAWRSLSGPVVLNMGLGSGAFSLFGNTLISSGYRSNRTDKIGDPDNFDFGLVGSLSFSPRENLTLGIEYSGYGVGFGPSFRPFPNIPFVATLYIYDLLWTPDELPYEVTPNFFGNVTFQF